MPHHNFLPVIGLRIHAKLLPPPLRYRQLVSLLGLWERDDNRGLNCRALAQAAHLTFGLPYPFTAPEAWPTTISDHTFDVVQLALFFRPTPDGSRQVVYQAGKTIAFCKFTELM